MDGATPMKKQLLRFLRLSLVVYVSFLLALALGQRRMIYLPTTAPEREALAIASASRIEPWRDAGGAIIGWKRPPRAGVRAANRLVVFHGNAGMALDREYFIDGFERLDGGRLWEVYLFEYPGYGARSGSPSQQTFCAAGGDALAALRAADSRPIYLLGESLGSGLACALAPRDIPGLVLITPFRRLWEVAAHHYPFLPVRMILRDPWDNMAALHSYTGPIAVLVASDDEVIPANQGRALHHDYPGPKALWVHEGATHNTLPIHESAPWWQEVSDFLLRSGSR